MSFQYSVKDRNTITKTLLEARNCKNSTDFTFITFDIYELLYPTYAQHIDPVFVIEAYNRETDKVRNILRSFELIDKIDSVPTLIKIQTAFRAVMDFFVSDYSCNQVFPLDSTDPLGEEIYSQLYKKYLHVGDRITLLSYDRRNYFSR